MTFWFGNRRLKVYCNSRTIYLHISLLWFYWKESNNLQILHSSASTKIKCVKNISKNSKCFKLWLVTINISLDDVLLCGVFFKPILKTGCLNQQVSREKRYYLMWGHENNLDAKRCYKQDCYVKYQQDIKTEKCCTKIDRNHKKTKQIPLQGTWT